MKAEKRFGEGLLVILVAVNLVEFWLATVIHWFPLMFFSMMFLASVDVFLILWYFMHLPRVLDEKEGHS